MELKSQINKKPFMIFMEINKSHDKQAFIFILHICFSFIKLISLFSYKFYFLKFILIIIDKIKYFMCLLSFLFKNSLYKHILYKKYINLSININ
jgi:hypothetical protein